MAVLDSLPGVEVTVIVDGKDLHEYQDADMEDDEDSVTKYIEAVDNANFAIKIKVTKDAKFKGDYMTFDVEVDGSWIQTPLISADEVEEGTYTATVKGVLVRRGCIRKLKFSALETVTEHGYGLPNDLERSKNLGKIEVKIYHKNIRVTEDAEFWGDASYSEGIISEKAIKGEAMTHSYSLDTESHNPDDFTFSDTAPVPGEENSAGIFVFCYRSKVSLRELMIIPRTPSPVPLEDRPVEELSPEEMAELLRRYKANASSTAEIKKELKREREDDNENNNPHANKRARSSADPVHLELNDDDTFTEIAVAPKEKIIIPLDD